MKIRRIRAVSFSPTGGTKKIVRLLADTMGEKLHLPVEEISFTLPEERKRTYTFSGEDLLLLGLPVYAGRIPNKILPDVESAFHGNRTPAIAVSVFGNRSFDDGLMELALLLEDRGFLLTAAAAAVSRHAFSDEIGAGRPDGQDLEELRAFAGKAAQKIKELQKQQQPAIGATALKITGHNPVGPYYTPLRADGQPARFLKAKPVTDMERCVRCGCCATACPMGSIDAADTSMLNGICIKCQACIRICPVHAKSFVDEDFLSHKEMLKEHYKRRAENAFFL